MGAFFRTLLSRRGFFGLGATTLLTSTTLTSCKSMASILKLAIVHTGDIHGRALFGNGSVGYAAIAALRETYEKKGYEVLLLDAGDAVQGDNLVNRSEGDTAIDIMNKCGYQAMTLGNHEFDYGQHKIVEYTRTATFPLLAANVIVEATQETLVDARMMLTLKDGTKVGIFGITTPETEVKANPLLMQGLTILDGDELYACAQKQAEALREEGADLVICLSHLGENEEGGPHRGSQVIAHTTGIDLFIDGHDHKEHHGLIKNADGEDVLAVDVGAFTNAVGVITLTKGTFTETLYEFGSFDGQDKYVAAYVQGISDAVSAELAEVIATTPYMLDGTNKPGIRAHETNLGDLVADAILWEASQVADTAPDCAIINAGSVRSSVEAGEISMGDVLNVLPFHSYACTTQVSGAALLEALEASTMGVPTEIGGFPQVANITFSVDATIPYEGGENYPRSTYPKPTHPGSRVTIADIAGRAFDPAETYTLATTDFICVGGDTYYALAEDAQGTIQTTGLLCSDCLINYLKDAIGGEVSERYAAPEGEGRITIKL